MKTYVTHYPEAGDRPLARVIDGGTATDVVLHLRAADVSGVSLVQLTRSEQIAYLTHLAREASNAADALRITQGNPA